MVGSVSGNKCDDESDFGDEAGRNDGDDDRNDDMICPSILPLRFVQYRILSETDYIPFIGSGRQIGSSGSGSIGLIDEPCSSTGQHTAPRRRY